MGLPPGSSYPLCQSQMAIGTTKALVPSCGRHQGENRGHLDPPLSSGALPPNPLPKWNCPFWNSRNRWWGLSGSVEDPFPFPAGTPPSRKPPHRLAILPNYFSSSWNNVLGATQPFGCKPAWGLTDWYTPAGTVPSGRRTNAALTGLR